MNTDQNTQDIQQDIQKIEDAEYTRRSLAVVYLDKAARYILKAKAQVKTEQSKEALTTISDSIDDVLVNHQ